jgi:hypothetical protein
LLLLDQRHSRGCSRRVRPQTPARDPIPEELHHRALFIPGRLDEILSWQRTTEQGRDTLFAELGRYLCEVRAGKYWRVDRLKSFNEFLEKKFAEFRRTAYYLMAIHERLPRHIDKGRRLLGRTKAESW